MSKSKFEAVWICYDYDSSIMYQLDAYEKEKLREEMIEQNEHLIGSIDFFTHVDNILLDRYNSILNVDMDFLTGKIGAKPSFEVYTTNEKQNTLVHHLSKLVTQMNILSNNGMHIHLSSIIDGMDGAIYYDIYDKEIDINHLYVLKCH